MINLFGLIIELKAAGIQFSGCNTDGVVWDLSGNQIQTRPDVAAVIAAHNAGSWTTTEQNIATRRSASRTAAKNIPAWATWTQADWTAHFNANLSDEQADLVTTLAAARVMIKRQNTVINALAKMLIALRDQIWPDLPEV